MNASSHNCPDCSSAADGSAETTAETQGPILVFREAVLARGGTPLSLSLDAGQWAAVVGSPSPTAPPVADAALGLATPVSGDILFLGRPWSDLSARAAAAARGRIGRTFSGWGWASNLDLDENLLLRVAHHSKVPGKQLWASLRQTAAAFGLDPIPEDRPADLPAPVLMTAQWVRAFVGDPLLIVLEHPHRGVYPDQVERLRHGVVSALAQGAAVLWMADRAFFDRYSDLRPDEWIELPDVAAGSQRQ